MTTQCAQCRRLVIRPLGGDICHACLGVPSNRSALLWLIATFMLIGAAFYFEFGGH